MDSDVEPSSESEAEIDRRMIGSLKTEKPNDEGEDELPPILAPPSTGYLHTVNANQPPPRLSLAEESDHEGNDKGRRDATSSLPQDDDPSPEVIDLKDSDEDVSTTTDSDDDLVDVDYLENPPTGFKNALKKYEYASKKDMWIFNVKKFYHSQPARIRRLIKMHKDVDGNPVEEPIEMLFEKINAERERMRKAQNIKCERGEDPDADVGPASVAKFKISSTDPKLTHVIYPGNVVNNDKAISTLGGLGAISKVFEQPTKKLTLKYRPHDLFANAANGQGRNTCGILLRVRRKKNAPEKKRSLEETPKINLDSLGREPDPVDMVHDVLLENEMSKADSNNASVKIDNKTYSQQDILLEDQILMEEKMREKKTGKAWTPGVTAPDCNLKIPKILETVPDNFTKVEPVGIVRRTYDFNGICDFQYLPMSKKADGTYISIKDKIFPIFGSKDNPEKLVCKGGNECRLFGLPPVMSRVDNPPVYQRGLMEDLIVSEKTPANKIVAAPDESIFSNRVKRIIYTVSYNFQVSSRNKKKEVPSQPLSMALADIERRQIKKELVEAVRLKFEERPIWCKPALEFATKIPSGILKYIIPLFAYFASNGPWRNTWIKFGLDPREKPFTVIYQSVDFRIPFIYRRFMDCNSEALLPPEIGHSFLPEYIPTKAQMFYQLCDIRLDEIQELIKTLKEKAEQPGALSYDERFGFLKEGSFEYFRYIMTFYLENLLQDKGKILEIQAPQTAFTIPPGSIEPQEKLRAAPLRRVKQKRMRKSTRQGQDGRKAKGKSPIKGPTTVRSNLDTLQDLELNKLPMLSDGDGEDDSYDEDDGDEDYVE